MRLLAIVLLLTSTLSHGQVIQLTDAQASEIGRRIWRNECGGTVQGLTSWNKGEEFPSLGICHFIWYPEGKRGPFQESFPGLMTYFAGQGMMIPTWMRKACPWGSRAVFLADANTPPMTQLRNLLATTVPQQARFAALRLEQALPKILAACPTGQRERVKANFYRVASQPLGMYALVDYVNFKGEGILATERYGGQGWGLLQALQGMPATGAALPAFVKSADSALTHRVANSPRERNEGKWLPGWRNRLQTYIQ